MRMTLVRPRDGAVEDVQRLLEELDSALAGSDGLVLSFVTQFGDERLGRVSIWQTREDADRQATRNQVLSLRSRLRFLSVESEETLMEVRSGHVPREVVSMLSGLSVEAAGAAENEVT